MKKKKKKKMKMMMMTDQYVDLIIMYEYSPVFPYHFEL